MLNRNLVCVLSILLGIFVISTFGSTASASELGSARNSLEARIGDAASTAAGAKASADAGATVSRRKRRRQMTNYKARNNARSVARYVFLDVDANWSGYGVRTCRRISRPRVDCYTYVYEDLYDEDGYYYDSVLCDWFTASAWLRNGRLKVWTHNTDCVYLSEI